MSIGNNSNMQAHHSAARAVARSLRKPAARAVRKALVEVPKDEGADGPAAQARMPEEARIVAFPEELDWVDRVTVLRVRRNRIECRLDALNVRGQLVDRLWHAGMLFRFYWLRSVAMQRVVASLGSSGFAASSGLHAVEAREHYRQRVNVALEHLRQPGGEAAYAQASAVEAVAGQDESCAGRLYALQGGLARLADLWMVADDYCRS
ncbi:hypothetical protein ACFFMP_08535 [Pseudoroseomonas cervicalis]|uniref:Uncharacterized protein n=1 Tax=Pseudoroseomonas cervicalis ATCC 49957 TaxID=525371 RepID=D5RTH0_9PROT|nr:hypothetical protein [Pseudoroseomonas cervicalis]EFH09401.1 hypothetical protein HMPREF0731_4382 [Pseudoroseomonas cervicalis ATCC 49957]